MFGKKIRTIGKKNRKFVNNSILFANGFSIIDNKNRTIRKKYRTFGNNSRMTLIDSVLESNTL